MKYFTFPTTFFEILTISILFILPAIIVFVPKRQIITVLLAKYSNNAAFAMLTSALQTKIYFLSKKALKQSPFQSVCVQIYAIAIEAAGPGYATNAKNI